MTPTIDWKKYAALIPDTLPDFDQESIMKRVSLAVRDFLEKDAGRVRVIERRVEHSILYDKTEEIPGQCIFQSVWDLELGTADAAEGIVDWKSSFESVVDEWQWRHSSAAFHHIYGRLPKFFEYRVLGEHGTKAIRVEPVPDRVLRESYDQIVPIAEFISTASPKGFWPRNFRACKGCPGYVACRKDAPPPLVYHYEHLSKSSIDRFLTCPESLRADWKQENRYMARGRAMHEVLAEIWRDHTQQEKT